MERIIFISDHASPLAMLGSPDSGGQNVYVAELARSLTKKGYEVDIFTRRECPVQQKVVQWLRGVRVIHVDAGPSIPIEKESLLDFMPEFALNVLQFIRQEHHQYSLIHAHFFMSGLVAEHLSAVLNIPYGITFHALGKVRRMHQGNQDRFPAERQDIESRLIANAQFIIAECPQDEQDLKDFYQADLSRVTVIPCGFAGREFYPVPREEARKKIGFSTDDKIVLQLGRMVPRKGIDNVIEAVGILEPFTKNLKLIVVGGEREWEQSAEYLRLKSIGEKCGVNSSLIFTGPKNREQLKNYYSAADVFVTTPWYEPFGITPLEAMACQTPVIGSAVGGIKYTVCDGLNGYLVPPKSPAMLATRLWELLNDKPRARRMGANGLKRVKEIFTWEKVALEMRQVYQSLASVTRNRETNNFLQVKIQRA